MTALPIAMAPWTPKRVAERLEQAAEVERRRPARHVRPAGAKSSWPTYQIQHALDVVDFQCPLPTPAEISLADEAMGWLLWIRSAEVRKVLWSKANRRSGRALMVEFGRSRKTLDRLCAFGWASIARKLNLKDD